MADIINQASVIRESLVGEPIRLPDAAGSTSAVREILFGEPPQPAPKFEVPVVVREVVLFDGRGTPPHLMQMVRETLTGEPLQPPVPAEQGSVVREFVTGEPQERDYMAGAAVVVREVVVKEAPFKAIHVMREVLVNKVEPVTLRHVATGLRQYALMKRPAMAKPSTVISFNTPFVLREIVTQKRTFTAPRSEMVANKLMFQIAMKRSPALEENTRSPIRISRMAWMATLSRGKAYVPVSEVVMSTLQGQYIMARAVQPAPQVRTAITTPVLVEQIIQSRNERAVVILTDAFVQTGVQQVVQKIAPKQYRSSMDTATLLRTVIQRRDVTPPGIDDRVATVSQAVAIKRPVPPKPQGDEQVRSVRNLVAQRRNIEPPFSRDEARVLNSLVLTSRITPGPAFVVGRHVSSYRMQSVHARTNMSPPISYRSGEFVRTLRIMSVHETMLPMHRSTTRVASLTLAWTIGKKFPLPWDVIDPAIGRHVANMNVLSVQHRDTTPPETISKESRYAYSVLASVVHIEKYPPPDMPEPVVPETFVSQVGQVVVFSDAGDEFGPVSAVMVRGISESLVVGDTDDWVDPTIPVSSVSVAQVMQSVAATDAFPHPSVPQSDAEVMGLHSSLVVGDSTMPDPAIPQSEIEVMAVVEFAAVGDVDLPDPTVPLSDAVVSHLAAFLAVRDPSLIGQFGMSEISSPSVVEFFVVRDPTLKGIPLRQGPRPVVSVTIS